MKYYKLTDKKINRLAEELKEEMLWWWRKNRKEAGFGQKCEQDLYDALCNFTKGVEKG